MKTQDFITEFKKTRDKATCCKRRVTTTYIPYEKKKALCEAIIKSSMYREVNGKKMFYVDSVIKYELYVLTLIKNYTDIELSSEGTEMLEDFNALEEANATLAITGAIGVDAKALDQMLQMMVDDEFANNSLEAKLDTKFEALEMMLGALGEVTKENIVIDK